MIDLPYIKKIFLDIISKYNELFGLDLSYMDVELSEHPKYNDGSISTEIADDEFGGSWTKNKIIYINCNPDKVIEHWNLSMSIDEFLYWIIAHELAHEIYFNLMEKSEIDYIIKLAKQENFTTEYLKIVKPEKIDEEIFAEYLAYLIN